jgi:phage anti-repressor protein
MTTPQQFSASAIIPLNSLVSPPAPSKLAFIHDARALHVTLRVRRDFSGWIKSRLSEAGATQGVDYIVQFAELPSQRIDYLLSPAAKERILQRENAGRTLRHERTSLRIIAAALQRWNPILQYWCRPYKIDCYLTECNIAIECDENGHANYDKADERRREAHIRQVLGCQFIRYSPMSKDFNEGEVIARVLQIALSN